MTIPYDQPSEMVAAQPRLNVDSIDPRTTVRRRALVITGMVVLDALAISAAFAFAYLVRFKSEWSIFYAHSSEPVRFYSTLVFLMVPVVLLIFASYRLYALRQIFDGAQEYARIVSASTLAMLLVVLLSFFLDGDLVISRGWIVISWVSLVAAVGIERFVVRRIVYGLRRRGLTSCRVALVAAGDDAQWLVERLEEIPASGIQVVTVINPDGLIEEDGHWSGTSLLRHLIREHQLDEVIVSSASVPQRALARIVREVAYLPTELDIVPGMYEIQTTGVRARELHGLPLVTLNKVRITGFDFALKRIVDYLIAGGGLLFLSPILLTLAIIVKITSPGPIFHRRQVIGERGRRFDALKFRTMFVNADEILAGQPELAEEWARTGKLTNDPRVTPIGHWLRRWSLDEIPQLINVLRGQMSLVGPRMITEREISHFGHWQENLVTVKPGLTGLWQVSGRSTLSYEDRVRLDMYYIRSYSIWQDLEILARTLPAVLRGVGAY